MAYVGTLTPLDASGTVLDSFSFINVNSLNGWPADSLQFICDAITSMGVDGTRMRDNRQDYPKFTMDTLSESANFTAAVTLAKRARTLPGFRATMTLTAGGQEYTFESRKLYIWGVDATPMAADVVSPLIDNGSHGLVKVTWHLQFIA